MHTVYRRLIYMLFTNKQRFECSNVTAINTLKSKNYKSIIWQVIAGISVTSRIMLLYCCVNAGYLPLFFSNIPWEQLHYDPK